MTRCLMLLSALVLVFAGAASADVKQGDTELNFLAGFTTQNGADDGADFDAWFLSGGLGYFLSDNIQVQAAGMFALTSTDLGAADVDIDVWGIGGRAKYHFMPTNQWVPYIGAQLLWVNASVDGVDTVVAALGGPAGTSVDGDIDGTLWGPVLGLRYALNENNDFYVEYQYQIWDGDVGDVLDDGHSLLLGIIHQFK